MVVHFRFSPFETKRKFWFNHGFFFKTEKEKQDRQSTFQGVLEGWFAGDEEGINAYKHEMSRKQINIPKVLDFNWLKSEKLTETRTALKHQKLKKLPELTGNVYPDLVKYMMHKITFSQDLVKASV